MNPKRFHIKIDLKLQAVTCPGVWLCSHGYLEVTIKALGYFFRTGAIDPYFPLLCHDRFKMEGYLKGSSSIGSLISNLNREPLEITLWQSGRRLSYYQGVIMDLIQGIEPHLLCPHMNTNQLLMKITPAFPGIIAPKVELTTQFHIKDNILNIKITNEDLKIHSKFSGISDISKTSNEIKPKLYRRPCTVQTEMEEDSLYPRETRKQRTVCHARNFKVNKDYKLTSKRLSDPAYSKSTKRRVSIDSSCSSNNTQTLEGVCEIERDGNQDIFEFGSHEQRCEICRLYKEIFLCL